jgi:hypothetical protein
VGNLKKFALTALHLLTIIGSTEINRNKVDLLTKRGNI